MVQGLRHRGGRLVVLDHDYAMLKGMDQLLARLNSRADARVDPVEIMDARSRRVALIAYAFTDRQMTAPLAGVDHHLFQRRPTALGLLLEGISPFVLALPPPAAGGGQCDEAGGADQAPAGKCQSQLGLSLFLPSLGFRFGHSCFQNM